MLFSVIVPVYNVDKYLTECINSIIENSENDYEIILVNDGSTDNSGRICDEFQKKYTNLCKVIHKKNQGLISARRAGLLASKGEYIVFVDSDDLIRKDTFHILKKEIMRLSPDMIIYQWQKIDENGNLLDSYSKIPFRSGTIDKDSILKELLAGSLLNSLCIKVCKRELYDIEKDYSDFYNIQYGEDLLQSIPLIEKSTSFVYIPEKLYLYRTNPTSLTQQINVDQYITLDVVRPQVYNMVERMGKMNEENTELFYHTYVESIARLICSICKTDAKDKISILNKMYDFAKVHEARNYLCSCKISYKLKIVLCMFYLRLFRSLIFLFMLLK